MAGRFCNVAPKQRWGRPWMRCRVCGWILSPSSPAKLTGSRCGRVRGSQLCAELAASRALASTMCNTGSMLPGAGTLPGRPDDQHVLVRFLAVFLCFEWLECRGETARSTVFSHFFGSGFSCRARVLGDVPRGLHAPRHNEGLVPKSPCYSFRSLFERSGGAMWRGPFATSGVSVLQGSAALLAGLEVCLPRSAMVNGRCCNPFVFATVPSALFLSMFALYPPPPACWGCLARCSPLSPDATDPLTRRVVCFLPTAGCAPPSSCIPLCSGAVVRPLRCCHPTAAWYLAPVLFSMPALQPGRCRPWVQGVSRV